MKTAIHFLFFLTTLAQVSAQTIRLNDSDILGVWEYKSDFNGLDSTLINYKNHSISEYTFLPTGVFEYRYFKISSSYNDTCLTSVVDGVWALENNELQLKYAVPVNKTLAIRKTKMAEWSSEYIIKSGNDSLIVFHQNNDESLSFWFGNGETKYYKRLVAPINISSVASDSCNADFNNLFNIPNIDSIFVINLGNKYLINSIDSTKIIQIPRFSNISIFYEEKLTDSIYDSKTFNGLGFLDSIYEDSMIVNLYQVNEELWLDDDFDRISTSTSIYHGTEFEKPYTIDLYNYPELSFSTSANDVIQSIAGVGMFTGLLSALVIAPLVSINYKTGDFRDHRYYSIAGYSLAAVTLSLPIYFLSAPRSYILMPKGGEIDQDHWYLSY